jgi:hypothetical protein
MLVGLLVAFLYFNTVFVIPFVVEGDCLLGCICL